MKRMMPGAPGERRRAGAAFVFDAEPARACSYFVTDTSWVVLTVVPAALMNSTV